jgi:hypothetical protein
VLFGWWRRAEQLKAKRQCRGTRPVYGGLDKFQSDPHWRGLIYFHEYFHSDNGAGIGASHQTGWTGLVAKLIEQSDQRI